MTKVLIIEDEESIRLLLRYDLKAAGYEVELAEDGETGLEMALSRSYDVLIVDWMLPRLSGLELVRKVREMQSQALIFMVTAKDEEQDVLEAFDVGVDDYLIKPFSPRQLVARLNAHLRRLSHRENQQQRTFGNVVISDEEHRVLVDGNEVFLTKTEFDLLQYLSSNLNKVMSREQILNDIWDFDYDGDTRIVDVHIFKLRSKLVNGSLQIKSLRGVGYVAKITA